jgi:hypothetical protein
MQSPQCCSPIVKAAAALTDGYHTTSADYAWVPYASALRSVNDSVQVEPFDVLILSDSLDRLMMEDVCKNVPGGTWLPAQNNKFPGFGEGATICRSAWGTLTWLLITGALPTGPYHFVGDEKEFYTPRRLDAAFAWYAAQAGGRAPHVVLYNSNLWDVALLWGENIQKLYPGISHFRQFMEPFSYTDPSVATRWLRAYVRATEANLAQIRRLAPPPATLLLTRTSPLTAHRLQSSVNTAIRKISAAACIPLIDWDEIVRVHMLDDQKWAQVQPGWYADSAHPASKHSLAYGMLFVRFLRFCYHTYRVPGPPAGAGGTSPSPGDTGESGGGGGNASTGTGLVWASCDSAVSPFLDWMEEP